MKKRQVLIAIEGCDGAGKETQAKLLATHYGFNLRSFPTHDKNSAFAMSVDAYLSGALGNDINNLNPYGISALYAIDRYASFVTDWGNKYNAGESFVFDRYMYSNLIYNLHKVPDRLKIKFASDCIRNELDMGLPMVDVNIYLHISNDVSSKLLAKRYDNNEDMKDIHEKSENLQKQTAINAAFLIAASDAIDNSSPWIVIECIDKNGDIKDIPTIHNEIVNEVDKFLYTI